jgi:hypothetical protein
VPDGFLPWNGWARPAARTLGLDAGRNEALFDWVTLDRPGSSRAPATAPTTQTATITQRNRTSNRAMPANILILP